MALRHIIVRENVHVFPDLRQVTEYWRTKDRKTGSTEARGVEESEAVFALTFERLASIPIYLRQPELARQLQEAAPAFRTSGGSKLYLPYLRHLAPDLIMKIKEDNQDSFDKFQSCLSMFIEAHKSPWESRALEMMKKVDTEVRELQEKFEKISKQRALKGFEVTVGLFSALLCLLLPAEAAQVLTPLLGSASALKGLTYVRSRKVDYFDVERSSYYIPWRLSQME